MTGLTKRVFRAITFKAFQNKIKKQRVFESKISMVSNTRPLFLLSKYIVMPIYIRFVLTKKIIFL